jgi:uncharacterized protein YukE
MSDGLRYNYPMISDLVTHINQVHAGHQANLDASHALLATLPDSQTGAAGSAAGEYHGTVNRLYSGSNDAINKLSQTVNAAMDSMQQTDAHLATQYHGGTAL